MTLLKIFSDTRLDPDVLGVLRDGATPHEIVLPEKPVESVLAKAEKDPAFGGVEIAFGQPDVESVRESDKLRWIHLSTAGYTRYDTPEFREHAAARGLLVTNSSSVYAEACAQHVLAFMLGQARSLPEALKSRAPNGSGAWNALRDSCFLLQKQTVLLLGYGAIAARLVEMLEPFDLEMVAMRRRPKGDEGVRTISTEELPGVLAAADHVVNILPDNADSAGFFDTGRFSGMKEGAVFYNIGRGTTVDQRALHQVLASGHLRAAWLDVTDPEPLPDDHPLRNLENCHVTPHTAGGYANESLALVRHFLANLHRFTTGEALKDRVM